MSAWGVVLGEGGGGCWETSLSLRTEGKTRGLGVSRAQRQDGRISGPLAASSSACKPKLKGCFHKPLLFPLPRPSWRGSGLTASPGESFWNLSFPSCEGGDEVAWYGDCVVMMVTVLLASTHSLITHSFPHSPSNLPSLPRPPAVH